MVTKFPPKFFRKQVSPWRETYERIRQGPVFPRHTAARNMRSTKKSNTFLYRYSTFLHTTLTTIHGTVSHLNETIKIGHFPFSYRRFRPPFIERILDFAGRRGLSNVEAKKKCISGEKFPILHDLFSKRKSVLKEKRKETNFRTISSSIIAGNDYLFPPVELKFSPCTELTKTGRIECRYEKYILQRKESRGRQRDPLPLPLPIKALKFSKYR